MSINHKLTNVIKGRTIVGTQNQNDKMLVTFDDGSLMTVKTAGHSNSAATGGKVKTVWQKDKSLTLDFESGTDMVIPLAEATSSVLLRDKNHVLEYAD